MRAYMGTKSMVTHKQIPHYMLCRMGTFLHQIAILDG